MLKGQSTTVLDKKKFVSSHFPTICCLLALFTYVFVILDPHLLLKVFSNWLSKAEARAVLIGILLVDELC